MSKQTIFSIFLILFFSFLIHFVYIKWIQVVPVPEVVYISDESLKKANDSLVLVANDHMEKAYEASKRNAYLEQKNNEFKQTILRYSMADVHAWLKRYESEHNLSESPNYETTDY